MLIQVLISTLLLVNSVFAHDRVIVGVLTVEISRSFEALYPDEFGSYIPVSYIKWVEQGGARIVPIWLGKDEDYYRKMVKKVNGILLPGGAVDKNKAGGYAEAAEFIFKIASELNDRNDFFPIWGIGLGMDMMLYLTNDKEDLIEECSMEYITSSLTLTKRDTKECALYTSTSDHIKNLMTEHPVAVLNTKKCYLRDEFDESKLASKWIIFSVNADTEGKIAVTAVEHRKYPFYGVMFHPEKVAFEWAEKTNFPHTLAAIEVTQYLANYFINECRKNAHWFSTKEEEDDLLIQNFDPKYTGKVGSSFLQSYMFPKDDKPDEEN